MHPYSRRSFPARSVCSQPSMARYSMKIEMLVYRFIFSIAIGFFIGSYVLPDTQQHFLQYVGNVVCRRALFPGNMWAAPVANLPPPPPRMDQKRGLLYVGMMSTEGYVPTRVMAALDTWAKNQRFRLEIFANNNGTVDAKGGKITVHENGARIIKLPMVADNSYPPQKKSFSMLKFIHDNYLDKFDWFLRLDDDSYLNVDKLTKFLSGVDASRPIVIGHAGYGRDADDYMCPGENYCMGGTGVIFSKEMLRRVGPELSQCLKMMFTEHEDVELGRCIRRVTGVSCTEAWETTNIFYQNYGGHGVYESNIESLSEWKRHAALILHANKDSVYQYKFHRTMLMDKITDLVSKIEHMRNEVKKMNSLMFGKVFDTEAWNSHAGYVWDAISKRSVYPATGGQPVHGIPSHIKSTAVANVYYTLQDLRIKYPSMQKHIREISMTSMRYFVNPLSSVDMIAKLKVKGKYKTSKEETSHFLNNVYFRKTFLRDNPFFGEEVEINFDAILENMKSTKGLTQVVSDPTERVNFVMALSGRPENLVRFLQNFKDCFLAAGENVSLTIVYFPDKRMKDSTEEQVIDVDHDFRKNSSSGDDMFDFVRLNMNQASAEYPSAELNLILVTNGLPFSRGIGLQMGAKKSHHDDTKDDLLFFCDVDLVFQREILLHIRRNTIRGKQVYYPVFFSQYDPKIVYSYQEAPKTHFYFEEIAGFWRIFSYGMVSIYRDDFLATGGFDMSIKGWGLEDLRFCDAVLKSKLQVFKSNEAAMVHVFHDKDCSPDLSKEQYRSCQSSRAQHFGPQTLMFYLWHRGSDDEDMESYEAQVDVGVPAKEDTK